VPDLENIPSFETMAGTGTEEKKDGEGNVTEDASPGGNLSADTVEAARNLDAVIGNLCKNFSDSVDYFKILVDVFRNELSTNKNTHLANFYMIIPALTVNFVEQILQAKDLMYKSHRKKESYFSDDGFAIGVAYILAILDQGKAFDSLHWFETVTIR
jgi:WASH complex subunit 7